MKKRFTLFLSALVLGWTAWALVPDDETSGEGTEGEGQEQEEEEISPYLIFPASGNNITVTQTGDYEFHLETTGDDPYISMSALQQDLTDDQTIVTFEYKTPDNLGDNEFFFSPIAAGREMTFSLDPAEDWTTGYVDISSQRIAYSWGAAGDYLRIDVSSVGGLTLDIRNIHFITRAEYMEAKGVTINLEKDADGFYMIKDADDMKHLAELVNGGFYRDLNVKLTSNIDMSAVEDYAPIGVASSSELNHTGQSLSNPGFAGVFDGQGYEIMNLTACYNSAYATSGVFGTITGTVKNLGVRGYTFNNGQAYAGRFAALAGQLVEGTIENCYVTASTVINTNEIVSGLVAGNYGGTVRNCCEYGNDIQAYSRAGRLIGDAADDNKVRVGTEINCYSEGYVTGDGCPSGYASNMSGCESNVSAERFASGEIAYKLNTNSEDPATPIFYQTPESDKGPVLDATHGYVIASGDSYVCIDTSNPGDAWTAVTSGEEEMLADAVGQADVLGAYEEYMNSITGLSSFSEFLQAYSTLLEMKPAVLSSIAAYKTYTDKIEYVQDYLANDKTFSGISRDQLERYLTEKVEPGTEFANGSYPYIIETCALNDDEIAAETLKVQAMLDAAIQGGYGEGADISSMLVNAQLDNDSIGWITGGTINVNKLHSTESQNVATSTSKNMFMCQQLEGLTPGIYMLELSAAYRADNNDMSWAQNAFLYLNDNEVYIKTTCEDPLPSDEEPAHASSYDPLENEDGEFLGYIPNSTQGYGYAFAAGYYKNVVAAEVGEDGKLELGLTMPGCNADNNIWIGEWKLTYCGAASTATSAAALKATIEGQTARLQNLIDHYVADDYNYSAAPNFDANLKSDVATAIAEANAAATSEDQLKAIDTLTELANEVYSCKQAYVDMLDMSEALLDVYAGLLTDNLVSEDEYAAMEESYGQISDAYLEGSYTLEQAEEVNPFKTLSNVPAIVDNVAQIGTPMELIMYATMVNSGIYSDLDGVLTADIDMSGITCYPPIGVADKNHLNHTGQDITDPGFEGVFDGQGHEVRNLMACMNASYATSGVFGTITGIVKNLGVRGYTFDNGGSYEGRFAALAGQLVEGTIENCYVTESTINDTGEIVSGLVAGNYGGTVKNCFEYGNKINTYSRAGHLIGDAADDNGVRIGTEINCWSESSVTGTYESNMEDCHSNVSASRFKSGEIAYILNGNTDDENSIIWYQTIYEDNCPVLDKTHLIVHRTESGKFANFDDLNTELYSLAQEAEQLAATTKTEGGEKLITDASQLSDNCQWQSGYEIAKILDGDQTTYFHSRIDTDLSLGTEYFQVNLNAPITAFNMEWYGRSDGAGTSAIWHDTPDKIRVEGSNTPNDESSWVEICTNQYPVEDIDGAYYMTEEPIQLGNAYSSIRFYILHSTHGMTYWNITEFQMYSVGEAGSSQYDTDADVRAAVDAVLALTDNAKAQARLGKGTEAQRDELKAAISALKALLGIEEQEEEDLMADHTGTELDPYPVYTVDDLQSMRKYMHVGEITYFNIKNDIDMSEVETWTPLNTWNDQSNGKEWMNWIDIEGNGHVISNFSCTEGDYASFFGVLCGNVRNLGFDNAFVVSASTGSGILAGYMGHPNFTDAEGNLLTSSLENVWVTGELQVANSYCGGLVGNIGGPSVIKNCYANVTMEADAENTPYVGGLVGRVRDALTMQNVYAAGSSNIGGGIVGGGQKDTTPASTYTNCVVWNNTDQNFGTTGASDTVSGVSYYDGSNFAELQQTVVGWGAPWSCDMAEGSYPVLDVTTGIKQIATGSQLNTEDKIYTINGIRVQKTTKGLYIINGKKVLVK